jgi:hypothetical protein
MVVTLNKKEYPYNFKPVYIEEYCNLQIYQELNELETEAGILSDFAEAFKLENNPVSFYSFTFTEGYEFIKDSVQHFEIGKPDAIGYIDGVKKFNLIKPEIVMLSPDNDYFNSIYTHKVIIQGLKKVLYFNEQIVPLFEKYFHYYFDEGLFKYSNLITLCMIVKNAGPNFEQVLKDNLNIIDRWCILDTGSTDGTQEVIRKVLKDKKGELYSEPFVDFKVSRNRCLDLAGKNTKFLLTLDDTYSIRGDLRKFLTEVRGDQFSDSFSLLIQSDDTEYYSNRIIKSLTGLRYIHRIHEVISDKNNVNVTVPKDKAIIFDNRSDYMEKRTNDRKQFDLELLFKEVEEFPEDPRALYYIAQTYGCLGDEINKAKYFELRVSHPEQGYIQEKIDALFELARCYNFKVNCETKELLTTEITDSMWERIKGLYLEAYSLDTNRPDSLYFIGIHYYLKGNTNEAHSYFKKAFEVGYPLNSQYSLKPTLSFHFLPKFLSETSYLLKDFQLGLAASSLFLTSQKYNNPNTDSWNQMLSWNAIFNQLCKIPEKPKIINYNFDLPIFCIVTDGGWEPWTGSDILTKGLGGSETWVIETARNVQQTGKWITVVFCNCKEPSYFEGVGYNPVSLFHEFIVTTDVKVCVVSRYTEYIPVVLAGRTEKIKVIFHDNLVPETVIPIHPKIELYGLTDWHSGCIKQTFPQFPVKTQHYGVNNIPILTKIKNSFIYSSFPNRGLSVLLKMWPRIIQEFPDSTLNIFCNLDHKWTNQVAPQEIREIKSLLKVNKTGITLHGWVPKNELISWWGKTEYFLYPCIFEETFCLTAMEAAASKTLVITNGLAGLSETAKFGITVPGNPKETKWQNDCLKMLFEVMEKRNFEEIINQNYNFAKSLNWNSQTLKFIS